MNTCSGFFMTNPKGVYDFITYVDSFYGVNDPIYPMMHQETKQPLSLYDIMRATLNYIDVCTDPCEHAEWGDGDSLDRERVRDILLQEYDYKYVPTGVGGTVH